MLDVAFKTFIELGYEGASVAEIARRAGSSKQTIYTRFPTKADLFKAVISRGTDAFLEIFRGLLVSDKPIKAVLQRYGEHLVIGMLQPESQQFVRTIIAASVDFPEIAQFFWEHGRQQAQAELSKYLEEQAHKHLLRMSDPAVAADVFESLCLGVTPMMSPMGIALHRDAAEIRKHVREAIRVFFAAYGPNRKSC